jgi:hypothetical protein
MLAAGAVLAGAGAASAQPAGADKPPGLSLAFRAFITLGPVVELGTTDGLRNRFIPITGGRIEGAQLQGSVLEGGGDWQSLRPDGLTTLEAKYTLKAADGALISIVNPGVRTGPPAVMQRLAAGERVDPALYYMRTAPRFVVPTGPHRWLMETLFIGVGKRWPDSVEIEFWQVA